MIDVGSHGKLRSTFRESQTMRSKIRMLVGETDVALTTFPAKTHAGFEIRLNSSICSNSNPESSSKARRPGCV